MPSLVEIGPMVLEKIFKCCQSIFAFSLLSPLGKVCDPTVEHFLPSLVEIGSVVMEKEMKMCKFTDRWLIDQKSSFVLSSGKLKSHFHCLNISVFL